MPAVEEVVVVSGKVHSHNHRVISAGTTLASEGICPKLLFPNTTQYKIKHKSEFDDDCIALLYTLTPAAHVCPAESTCLLWRRVICTNVNIHIYCSELR